MENWGPVPEPAPSWDHDEVLRMYFLGSDYYYPSDGLLNSLEKLADSDLPDFATLLQEIDRWAFDYPREPETCLPSIAMPETDRAQAVDSDTVRIPVCDRTTLKRYLNCREVQEAVRQYCDDNLDLEMDDVADSDGDDYDEDAAMLRSVGYNPLPAAHSDQISMGKIVDLPKIRALDHSLFLTWVGMYFWNDRPGRLPYHNLWDTLPDIAQDIPANMVLPLIRLIEELYPKDVDGDGCIMPVVSHITSRRTANSVENGIVWQFFSIDELRNDLISHLERRSASFSEYDDMRLFGNFLEAYRANLLLIRKIDMDAIDYDELNRIDEEVANLEEEIIKKELS